MKFDKAFSFVFEDDEWIKKLLIGSIAMIFVPFLIGSIFVIGYFIGIMNRIITHTKPILPEWEDIENIFKEGINGFLISIVYFVMSFIILAVYTIVMAIIGKIIGAGIIYTFFSFSLGFIVFLLLFPLMVVYPISLLFYAATGSFKDAFDFVAIYHFLQNNIVNYIMVALISYALYLLANMGIIFLGVGIFITYFYATIVSAYLYGKLYVEDIQRNKGIPVNDDSIKA